MNNYKLMQQIGQGAHGTVFKATQLDTGLIVAIKRIHIVLKDAMPINLYREINALKHLDHVNIISLIHVFAHNNAFNLCFEYIPNDLSTYIKCTLSQVHIKSWTYMLLSGLDFMHKVNIIHRDLKPANLLISQSGVLKIADFGQARLLPIPNSILGSSADGPLLSHQVATRHFRAPELLYGSRTYSNAVDLWAVGCIFAELLNKTTLFPGQNDIDQLYVVQSALGSPNDTNWPDRMTLPDYGKIIFPEFARKPMSELVPTTDPNITDLMSQFLVYYGPDRITASAALQHPYFTNEPYVVDELDMDGLVQEQ